MLAGLTTTVQPAANAGATLWVIMALGKFHGVIAATTEPNAPAPKIATFMSIGRTGQP